MTRSGPQASGPLVLDFVSSSVGGEGVEVARKVVPAGTVVRQGGDFPSPRNAREVVTFLSFLMVGMAPPFSLFLTATLEEFTIHLVHLTPNAVLTLALFAHACEMFVGVQPSVELFCHFFAISWSPSLSPGPGTAPQAHTVGGVFLQWRSTNFLPLAQRDKWENWEWHWLYVEVDDPSPLLRLP